MIYDIQVFDVIDNECVVEIRKNGEMLLKWMEFGFYLVKFDVVVGIRFDKLCLWIDMLELGLQELVCLLQWGNMLVNGCSILIEQ